MSDPVRFGLIGCGEIAVQTSKAMLECECAVVVHCADPVENLAIDLAGKHDARHSARAEDLLANENVEAVIISTPHWLHSPLAVQAAEAGKHVIGEKPMACTLPEADAMIDAAAEAGVQLGVFFPSRYGRPVRKARELITGGALGRIVGAKLYQMTRKPDSYWEGGFTGRSPGDWRKSLATSGGGILIMNLVHALDAMIYMIDPKPQRIYAEYDTFATTVEVEDYLTFVMRCQDGSIVTLDGSSAAFDKAGPAGDRIFGENGHIVITDKPAVYLNEPWGDIPAGELVPLIDADAPKVNDRTAYIDDFVRAIRKGEPIPVPGPEARRSLEIIRGAYLSMQRGCVVEFPVVE